MHLEDVEKFRGNASCALFLSVASYSNTVESFFLYSHMKYRRSEFFLSQIFTFLGTFIQKKFLLHGKVKAIDFFVEKSGQNSKKNCL